ncbi:hypothetical protein SEA27A368_37500 [Salmonella enterica]|nr:hypothetical protein SEA27A368_37500 [Salmonella enterica]
MPFLASPPGAELPFLASPPGAELPFLASLLVAALDFRQIAFPASEKALASQADCWRPASPRF